MGRSCRAGRLPVRLGPRVSGKKALALVIFYSNLAKKTSLFGLKVKKFIFGHKKSAGRRF